MFQCSTSKVIPQHEISRNSLLAVSYVEFWCSSGIVFAAVVAEFWRGGGRVLAQWWQSFGTLVIQLVIAQFSGNSILAQLWCNFGAVVVQS